jgi:hypothetical protein
MDCQDIVSVFIINTFPFVFSCICKEHFGRVVSLLLPYEL